MWVRLVVEIMVDAQSERAATTAGPVALDGAMAALRELGFSTSHGHWHPPEPMEVARSRGRSRLPGDDGGAQGKARHARSQERAAGGPAGTVGA